MGPVFKIARSINDQRLDIQLAIIAGRNTALKEKLEACELNQPTSIYPFVNNMAQMMAASDILITKAGPATVSEACVAGLPMILSGHVPGQEDGNVRLVVEQGAGVYAPGPKRVAQALAEWVNNGPDFRQRYAKAAKELGCPEAAWTIAAEIHRVAQSAPVPVLQPHRVSGSVLFHRSRISSGLPKT
jgi:1,2-diacylglycerol 3-beta-galactosyltransferase